MNTQPVSDEYEIVRNGREDYIKRARERCMANYYGDKMKPKDEILREIALKKQNELKVVESKPVDYKTSTVIPFEEGKQQRLMKTMDTNTKRLDADAVNLILKREAKLHESTLPVIENENSKVEYEMEEEQVDSENIPTTSAIMKMSGIEENPGDFHNEYMEDFSNLYKKEEPENFVTSIQSIPEVSKTEYKKEQRSFRLFAVRCILAFILLAAIIILDKMKISYQNYEAKDIYEAIISNDEMKAVEEFFVKQSSADKETTEKK